MLDKFANYLKNRLAITQEQAEEAVSCLKIKTIKKGHHFLSSGEIARYAAFVLSGHFAYTIIDDEGNEKIIKFGLSNATNFKLLGRKWEDEFRRTGRTN